MLVCLDPGQGPRPLLARRYAQRPGEAGCRPSCIGRPSRSPATAAVGAAIAAGAGLYFTARAVGVNRQALIETRQANRDADRR
jgi:hypothetical protein